MEEMTALCGRDVVIYINGKKLLQAESAQLRRSTTLHRVRTCFYSGDVAHLAGRREYKLNLIGVRFRQPFENCNFYDLDQFVTELSIDGECVRLEGCMWDDFNAVANKESFREHISIVATDMKEVEQIEGS